MDCPKCLGKLQRREVSFVATSGVSELQGAGVKYELHLDQCFVCGGVWFDKGELNKYLSDNIEVIDSPSLGRAMDKELDDKHGPCPHCNVNMEKIPAPKADGISMEQCKQCEGVWLDPTEIDRLERVHQPKVGILQRLFRSLRRD